MNNISTQNNLSFQGNLYTSHLRLPKKKFKEVAKIYAQKTEGKPDLTLSGEIAHRDDDGKIYHIVRLVSEKNNDISTIPHFSLKNMFDKLSPKKFADELINVCRIADPEDPANVLRHTLNRSKKSLAMKKFHIENLKSLGKDQYAAPFETIVKHQEKAIEKYKKQLQKIEPKSVSGEWAI